MAKEKSPERTPPAPDVGAAVLVVNTVVAGLGGLYVTTGSVAVTLVAAGSSAVLSAAVLWRRR
ncbi:hypothetical protein ABZ816_13660 [Actinosynnema sp. NPDC047251]|uniref:Putative membrane protein n=1 Tax=Saccharothrix espanaensis (strain ATCC 51144 / DSM 44229 / JCM 9112 / NBRC 15066 / NRRL 15764) TaxID=1179773 RepID=K0KGK0_SACES|nr:hypothetical protein [Saccharothrix espanaensis]CCH35643.1 putative membrane protein [Saccharothrix espanaensis DSM 44229]